MQEKPNACMTPAERPGIPQQKANYHPTGKEGRINGTINFKGKAPKRQKIDMYADAVCPEINSKPLTENVLVSNGKLANVFVYVKSGGELDLYEFEIPASPALLAHNRCRYSPHLLGVRVGQTLKITNEDPTTHNTNARAEINESRNKVQSPKGEILEWIYSQPETFISFKCNQHPWEKAYVGVFSHPFFAISDDGGSYSIEGLPPGEYTIVAWHEKLGEQRVKLTISPQETKELSFTFEGS